MLHGIIWCELPRRDIICVSVSVGETDIVCARLGLLDASYTTNQVWTSYACFLVWNPFCLSSVYPFIGACGGRDTVLSIVHSWLCISMSDDDRMLVLVEELLADGSVQCSSMAMEECALNSHETKNVVCCAKHHSPVPCTSCAENERLVKEAVKKREEEDKDEKEKREAKEEQGDKDEMT